MAHLGSAVRVAGVAVAGARLGLDGGLDVPGDEGRSIDQPDQSHKAGSITQGLDRPDQSHKMNRSIAQGMLSMHHRHIERMVRSSDSDGGLW
jgi:hypothetical protein